MRFRVKQVRMSDDVETSQSDSDFMLFDVSEELEEKKKRGERKERVTGL